MKTLFIQIFPFCSSNRNMHDHFLNCTSIQGPVDRSMIKNYNKINNLTLFCVLVASGCQAQPLTGDRSAVLQEVASGMLHYNYL